MYDVGKRGLQPPSWGELRGDVRTRARLQPRAHHPGQGRPRGREYINMVDMLDTLDEARMQRFSIIAMTDADKAAAKGGGL